VAETIHNALAEASALFLQRQVCVAAGDLGKRCGHRHGDQGPPRNCNLDGRLARSDEIDQLFVREQRRTLDQRQPDFRLIGCERMHDHAGAFCD
jgi:hypothetical protein